MANGDPSPSTQNSATPLPTARRQRRESRSMRDFSDDIEGLRRRHIEAATYLKIDEQRARQPQLETEASRPDLWDDADRAREVTAELSAITDDLERYDRLGSDIDDVEVLAELAREEGDPSVEPEIEHAISTVADAFGELELRSLFTGEHDERDAICEIQSGEGGADAQDFANMLLRMYLRWADDHGFPVELNSVHEGGDAGSSSASFILIGLRAVRLWDYESGVYSTTRRA